MTVVLPLKTTNPLNGSWGRWQSRSFARRKQRTATVAGCRDQVGDPPALPLTITLCRVAPSNGLDDDALPASLKAVRDGVTDWLGLSDDRATSRLRWQYAQRRGVRGAYAVEITLLPLVP